jgi:signal transduction histidine kinase
VAPGWSRPADGAPAGAGLAGASSPPAGSATAPAQRKAFRYALKDWRVRSRLLLLVVLPTSVAVILGGLSVTSSVRSAAAYQRVETLARLGGQITRLAQALQTERVDTIRYITRGPGGGGRGSPRAAAALGLAVLAQDYRATDQLGSRVRSMAGAIGGSYPPLTRREALGAITAIGGMGALRSVATGTQIPSLVVIQEYARTISQLLALEDEIAAGSNDAALADAVRSVGHISRMKEEASQEQAILTSALTPDLVGAAQVQPGQLSALNAAQAEQQADMAQFGLTASGSQRQLYQSALSSAQADRAQAQVQQAITLASGNGSSAENPVFTNAASSSVYLVASLHRVEQGFMSSIIGQSGSLRGKAIASARADGAGVVLLLALALVFTVAVVRSMTRPLRKLRTGALEVAGMRLPETVRLMSAGDSAGAPLEIEPIEVDSADEIGEVARAFDQVHQEAVRLAANEAALRGNVNAMFVNLSRRSQSLVERQIRLIDELEQGEQDSDRLASLFRMDHLATRMRRNSENLLVLAGHELSRRWTEPVALMDVLRAAVSEIEQYGRVALDIQPGISVRGQAVKDVVHLLSELTENATALSPANTQVTVSGHLLSSGGALLDITDQGVGMSAEEMAHANWRLDNPPVVDVAVSRRMGLFVVSRLAVRHGIRVRLRPAASGGVTALVWLPDEAITSETAGPALNFGRWQLSMDGVTTRGNGTEAAIDPGSERTSAAHAASAAAQAVSAARVAHFEPLRPEAGDAGEAGEAVASPQEGAAYAAAPPPANGAASPAAGLVVPPPASTEETRLPIFESVESDWFRRGQRGADPRASLTEPEPAGWSSPGDEGWRAAEVTQAPVTAGTTTAGLPVRVPNANLVPGGIGSPVTPPAPAPARPASQARERLASFQRGLREARGARPGDEGTWR